MKSKNLFLSILLICINISCSTKNVSKKVATANSELIKAIANHNQNQVKAAIKKGANTNLQTDQLLMSTPLIAAIRTNQPEITKILLEANADINKPDKNGNLPILVALEIKNIELIKTILENAKDIDFDNTNKEGESFLDILKQIDNKQLKEEIENLIENYIKNQPIVRI